MIIPGTVVPGIVLSAPLVYQVLVFFRAFEKGYWSRVYPEYGWCYGITGSTVLQSRYHKSNSL